MRNSAFFLFWFVCIPAVIVGVVCWTLLRVFPDANQLFLGVAAVPSFVLLDYAILNAMWRK